MDSTAIREALELRGWSQAKAGEVVDLPQSAISKRLRGVIPWRVEEVKTLAAGLGCSTDDLLADTLPDATREQLASDRCRAAECGHAECRAAEPEPATAAAS